MIRPCRVSGFLATAAVLLALPAAAQADTLCVSPGGAGGCFATIQGAAGPATDGDTIQIAAGTYLSQELDTPERLEFVGAGSGTLANPAGTVLVGPTGGVPLTLRNGGTVRDLALLGGPAGAMGPADALRIDQTPSGVRDYVLTNVVAKGGSGNVAALSFASGLTVTADNPTDPAWQPRIRIEGGGIAGGVVVGAGFNGGAGFVFGPAGGTLTMEGTAVEGPRSNGEPTGSTMDILAGQSVVLDQVVASGRFGPNIEDVPATVSRSRFTGLGGYGFSNGIGDAEGVVPATLSDSLIITRAGEGEPSFVDSALRVASENLETGIPALTVRGSTIYASGPGADAAAAVTNLTSGAPPSLELSNTVARVEGSTQPNAVDLLAEGGTISAGSSAFSSSRAEDGGSVPSPGLAGDPLFVNPAGEDFSLQSGSPLIDAGNPTLTGGSTIDLAGAQRVIDGNDDGTALPDVGAFESPLPPNVLPAVSGFRVSNKRFAPRRAGASAVKRGTRFVYSLSERAAVGIVVERRLPGRRVRRRGTLRCVKPTLRNRRRPRCKRFKRAGTLRAQQDAGAKSLAFSGRFGRRTLKPGRYRATITATDARGGVSAPRRASFRIVRAKRPRR